MCCGRGIKNAASRQYVSPLMGSQSTIVDIPKAPHKPELQSYPTYKKIGAYYGNPVKPKL